MDRFNGGSYGNGARLMKFHLSSQWSPQLERVDGGSYGRSPHLSQWSPQLERVDGGSYGRSPHLSQWSGSFDVGSYGKSSHLSQWNGSSDGASYGRALSLPQVSERVDGGSYGKSPHLSQWNGSFDGVSYGRTLSLPQVSERIDGGSYGRALSSQWKPSLERVEGVSYGKATRVLELNTLNQWKAHFEASKQTNKLMVIYFTAAWCKPCKVIEPAINDMAAKFTDVDFIKIDTDKLVSVSAQYGIQTMPTFILMKNGKEVDKVSGVKKEELQLKVTKHKEHVYY